MVRAAKNRFCAFFATWQELFSEALERGVKAEGLKLQIAIFGDGIIQGNENTPADMKHFRRFLSENCFGDYYTRAGLDLKLRELISFVFLVALGGCEA